MLNAVLQHLEVAALFDFPAHVVEAASHGVVEVFARGRGALVIAAFLDDVTRDRIEAALDGDQEAVEAADLGLQRGDDIAHEAGELLGDDA